MLNPLLASGHYPCLDNYFDCLWTGEVSDIIRYMCTLPPSSFIVQWPDLQAKGEYHGWLV